MHAGSHLEAEAAIEVPGDVLLQEDGPAGVRLQGDGEVDGLRGPVDLSAQGLRFAPPHQGARRHQEDAAGRDGKKKESYTRGNMASTFQITLASGYGAFGWVVEGQTASHAANVAARWLMLMGQTLLVIGWGVQEQVL